MPYRGRFAPSPTGPLHFGSLVAAAASYLDARACGGEWLLRMEDVDTARTQRGAADAILRALEVYGFAWHGEVLWQSRRTEAYREALEKLKRDGHAYACGCSRSAGVYAGTCRQGLAEGRVARAWRMRTPAEERWVEDRLYGRVAQNLEAEVGDFVLLRADGLFAYQLAVVVDDEYQGITHVVRGADLLDSTPRQRWLIECLEYRVPSYLHVPVVRGADGDKLSKQSRAEAIPLENTAAVLARAFAFLNHAPPAGLGIEELWRWGERNWDCGRLPREAGFPGT